MFCREQAARMNELVNEFDRAGVQIVGIGNGTPLMAQDFASQFLIRFPLYTDPEKATYKHFGMKRLMGLSLGTMKRGWATYRKGFRQGSMQGDAFQQGGVVLVEPSGNIIWSHIDEGPGMHAKPEQVRKAVKDYKWSITKSTTD